MTNLPADESKEVMQEALIAEIANLRFLQIPEQKIADALNLTRHKVRKLINSPEYKTHIEGLVSASRTKTLLQFSSRMDELAPLAFEALREHLTAKNLKAVETFMKVAGLIHEAPENAGNDTKITVVLPGATEPKDIDADYDSI